MLSVLHLRTDIPILYCYVLILEIFKKMNLIIILIYYRVLIMVFICVKIYKILWNIKINAMPIEILTYYHMFELL